MKFTEEKLEQAFIELLGNEYFPHHFGNNIKRAVDEVLIEEDLINYLLLYIRLNYLKLSSVNLKIMLIYFFLRLPKVSYLFLYIILINYKEIK